LLAVIVEQIAFTKTADAAAPMNDADLLPEKSAVRGN
jgi:hypothetical protein